MIGMRALRVMPLPVGDDVLMYNDNVVITPNDVGCIDLGISTCVDCLAIQRVESKFPAVVVSVGKTSYIMRVDLSCFSKAGAVNMVGQDDVPWCGVCISIQGLGRLVEDKR